MPDRRDFLLAIAATLVAARAGAETPVIRVGYQLPLTGGTAQYGQDFRNAAEIALDRFNTSGKPFRVEIVFEDSRSESRDGIAIARKFVDDKSIVAVLGDFTSGVSMASGQVYAHAGMPQLSQTASAPDYTKISKWQFRNITTQAQEGPYNADWLVAKGYKRVAVIAEQSDWGQSVVPNFEDALRRPRRRGGVQRILQPRPAGFPPDHHQDRARRSPTSIYAGFFYEDAAQFLKQMKQLGVTIPVHSTSAAYNQQLLTLAGADAEGLHLTATFLPSSPEPRVQDFVAAWKAKTGQAEPGQFPAQAYDAVNILLAAIDARLAGRHPRAGARRTGQDHELPGRHRRDHLRRQPRAGEEADQGGGPERRLRRRAELIRRGRPRRMDYYLQQVVIGLSLGMTYALMAIGFTLIFGVLNVVNFAHGEVYTIGAFAGLHGDHRAAPRRWSSCCWSRSPPGRSPASRWNAPASGRSAASPTRPSCKSRAMREATLLSSLALSIVAREALETRSSARNCRPSRRPGCCNAPIALGRACTSSTGDLVIFGASRWHAGRPAVRADPHPHRPVHPRGLEQSARRASTSASTPTAPSSGPSPSARCWAAAAGMLVGLYYGAITPPWGSRRASRRSSPW